MTELEKELLRRGNALARAIGHRMGFSCPKVSPAVPCTCGAGTQQMKALADWDDFVVEKKLDMRGQA